MTLSPTTVFRVRGLPSSLSSEGVSGIIERSLHISSEGSGLSIGSLAEDFYHPSEQVATLSFLRSPPKAFFTNAAAANEWTVDLIGEAYDSTISRSRTLRFDTHFRGVTALSNPHSQEEAVDCVVVCGLGGHAFGSFKEKGASYMWLRDTLPRDFPNLRILLYGYESGLDGSESHLNISGIAETFIGHLRGLRRPLQTIPRPLIMIAHSLGGLVVKQAIIKLSRGDQSDKNQMQSIMGLLFFGVPNRGMDIASLRAMVGDQPNRYILESIGQDSDLLVEQDVRFGHDFHYRDSPIFSFYETKTSPTALKIDGVWRMAGDRKLLVGPFSAKNPRHWEPELHHESFDRTHSDLVKFAVGDLDYERVRFRLSEIVDKAKETLTSRYLSQESTNYLSADEEACLRSLSFAEMNAREGQVEPADPDTGDWLLQSQDFQDWAQRKRFDQHHGFFWIQGNPGSGKSTLMKKAYSHIQTLSRDPTSIIAAFFFNKRGSEIEKSPTGLFRTLLHALCQHISALRAVVMKKYCKKRGLLDPSWEWQSFELKELLSSVVTAQVLGQRNVILCVDALDECDVIGAKSVIQFFEHLADASIREKTKFNVCLSSRYWPQLTIQHCFNARVEIENHGDIASYIHEHMTTMQAFEIQKDQLATLETILEDKAQGVFLWVVLVVQELLYAHENGATLGELERILHRVPQDLLSFYQSQIQKSEHDDGGQMLSMLQCVFYSLKPLTSTELQYLLAFGHTAFPSYSEWIQSSEFIMSDAHMEKRIRDKSKGLLEMAEITEYWVGCEPQNKRTVQFIHQTIVDFLSKDGFEPLRGQKMPNDAAHGHDFMKVACFNYLRTTDLQSIPVLDFRFYSEFTVERKFPTLYEDHPLLEYAVDTLFPHAALAEKHGIPQDGLRSHIVKNSCGSFERWKYLKNLISLKRQVCRPECIDFDDCIVDMEGPEVRPLHIFAQYGLLVPGMNKLEEDLDIQGGRYFNPLFAAAAGGHKDAVRYLLDLGADPQVSDPYGDTAYGLAVCEWHVGVLQMLLEHPRSDQSLDQRILIASIQGHNLNESVHHKQIHQMTALLIPEDSIPVSAIDPICRLIRLYESGPLISLILDKCEAALFRHKSLWIACIKNFRIGIDIIQKISDGLEMIEICEQLLDALHYRDRITDFETVKIATILFERCDVKMTKTLIDQVMLLSCSSQILKRLANKGDEIPPLTCRQVISALREGSPESVTFAVQHAPDGASSDEMLKAAISNQRYNSEAVRILLGLRNIDRLCEGAVRVALTMQKYRGDGGFCLSLLGIFEDRWGTIAFSVDALVIALSCIPSVVEFVLSRCERFSLTESLVHKALGSAGNVHLLLSYDAAFKVQDNLIARTVAHGHDVVPTLETYVRLGKPLALTEEVVRAAGYTDFEVAVEALDFIFRHDSNAKISDAMILEVLRSRKGSHLITWMLETGPSICIQEDFLINAASNPHDGARIFEAFQQKGRIRASEPLIGVTQPPPAKRQRVSSNPSPPLRDKSTNSVPITTRVIEAAAANRYEDQRWNLFSLFQKWGVLTDENVDLFRF